ncbi:MAG: FAD-dependent oxidoreductase [Xenococcaceae cyanobacterium]
MSYDFDLFVIGAGSGGIACARRAAEYGAKVGITESDRLGGTCVNRGCIPKKLMVYSSRFPAHFEEAQGYGWSPVQSTLDWSKLIVAVDKELERLNRVYQGMLARSGVEIIKGYARFVDSHTVEIGDRKVSADKILIAVGGRPVKPQNIPGIEHAIVSDNMFHLQEQPQRLVILGGGYIGVEFAFIMHGLGSEVTQIIRADHTLSGQEERTLMKLVVDQDSDRVLGAHMLGEHAAEIIQGVAIAIKTGGKKSDFDATVGIHPTAAEEFVTMR